LLFVQVGRGKLVRGYSAFHRLSSAQVKSPAEATVKLRWESDPEAGSDWQLVTSYLHSIVYDGPPPKRQHLEE
jgi:heme-degrading monooxygenase HmoA